MQCVAAVAFAACTLVGWAFMLSLQAPSPMRPRSLGMDITIPTESSTTTSFAVQQQLFATATTSGTVQAPVTLPFGTRTAWALQQHRKTPATKSFGMTNLAEQSSTTTSFAVQQQSFLGVHMTFPVGTSTSWEWWTLQEHPKVPATTSFGMTNLAKQSSSTTVQQQSFATAATSGTVQAPMTFPSRTSTAWALQPHLKAPATTSLGMADSSTALPLAASTTWPPSGWQRGSSSSASLGDMIKDSWGRISFETQNVTFDEPATVFGVVLVNVFCGFQLDICTEIRARAMWNTIVAVHVGLCICLCGVGIVSACVFPVSIIYWLKHGLLCSGYEVLMHFIDAVDLLTTWASFAGYLFIRDLPVWAWLWSLFLCMFGYVALGFVAIFMLGNGAGTNDRIRKVVHEIWLVYSKVDGIFDMVVAATSSFYQIIFGSSGMGRHADVCSLFVSLLTLFIKFYEVSRGRTQADPME